MIEREQLLEKLRAIDEEIRETNVDLYRFQRAGRLGDFAAAVIFNQLRESKTKFNRFSATKSWNA